MTSVDGSVPISMPIYKGQTIYEGSVLTISGTTLALATSSGSQFVAIADQATVDAEQTARVTRDGEYIGVHLAGTGHIVRVKSTAVTYTIGEGVYVGNTTGYCMDLGAAGAGANRIGTSKEAATAVAADLITVVLDNPSGATKGAVMAN